MSPKAGTRHCSIADYLQSVARARQIYPLISTLVDMVFFASGRHHGRRRRYN